MDEQHTVFLVGLRDDRRVWQALERLLGEMHRIVSK
jgi:hypothetical protein